MLFNSPSLQNIGHAKVSMQLREAEQRLQEVKGKVAAAADASLRPLERSGDWTQSYKVWDGWDDIEELKLQASAGQEKVDSIMSKFNVG
jgi:hypothetical protein